MKLGHFRLTTFLRLTTFRKYFTAAAHLPAERAHTRRLRGVVEIGLDLNNV